MAAVPTSVTLRSLRYRKHLSLQEVADALQVHPTTVSAWETGKYKPGIEYLGDLAELYGQPVEVIVQAALNPTPSLGKSRPKRRLQPRPALP